MDTQKLKELRGQAEERRKQLHEIFEQAGSEMDMDKVKCVDGDSAAKAAHIKSLNDELSDLGKQLEPLEAEYAELEKGKREADAFAAQKGHPLPDREDGEKGKKAEKSIGDLIIDSQVAHDLKGRDVELPDVGLKTLFQTSAGWAPETTRTGRLVLDAQRPIQVTDIVPSGTTSQSAVVYMEETTFTNEAAETAEGNAYKEVALKVEEKSSTVRKVTAWLPVTDEQLEDEPMARGYINNRLPFMVRQRLDGQILVGDGEAPNLGGFLNTEGTNTQEKGEDPTPDAVYKGATKVRVTGRANPGAVVFHPNDWQQVRLLRTNDGIYIWGSPAEAGPERIWGIPVVQSDAITEGTALVGDFAGYSELAVRRGLEVKVSESHEDYFVKGKQAIRASLRCALVVYRPAAFTEVTGI